MHIIGTYMSTLARWETAESFPSIRARLLQLIDKVTCPIVLYSFGRT
jgi:hypothetical protein